MFGKLKMSTKKWEKTKQEKKVDAEELKQKQQKLDVEQHKKLTKSLSDVHKKKLDETDKIITKVETNLIDNENSNLHIIKNFSKFKKITLF